MSQPCTLRATGTGAAELLAGKAGEDSEGVVKGGLAYQIPYFDLNLRMQLKYLQGQQLVSQALEVCVCVCV
jgi:hypothetical protein